MVDIQQILHTLQAQKKAWVTRFAPSPTGYLHLGHFYAAEWVWQLGRAINAKILLRIEDHDLGRARPEYIEAIVKDLAWLGYAADAQMPLQSERQDRYRACLQQLIDQGFVYRCTCSRKQIKDRTAANDAEEPVYDGYCRGRQLPIAGEGSLRLRIDHEHYQFSDLRLGLLSQEPASQCGDFVILDRDGYWSYHFAVTIDDYDQGVNLIIRGEDILPSTGRQIYLQKILGLTPIDYYLHHQLIYDSSGQKMSKRQKSVSIAQLREQGEDPAKLRQQLESLMDSSKIIE